jgi:hypothetical protein
MDSETIVKKNLDLHAEWMRYLFEHPEAMDQIPEGAQVVILPTDDPELAQENAKTLRAAQAQGVPIVVVHLTSPKPPTPQIEVLSR